MKLFKNKYFVIGIILVIAIPVIYFLAGKELKNDDVYTVRSGSFELSINTKERYKGKMQ